MLIGDKMLTCLFAEAYGGVQKTWFICPSVYSYHLAIYFLVDLPILCSFFKKYFSTFFWVEYFYSSILFTLVAC